MGCIGIGPVITYFGECNTPAKYTATLAHMNVFTNAHAPTRTVHAASGTGQNTSIVDDGGGMELAKLQPHCDPSAADHESREAARASGLINDCGVRSVSGVWAGLHCRTEAGLAAGSPSFPAWSPRDPSFPGSLNPLMLCGRTGDTFARRLRVREGGAALLTFSFTDACEGGRMLLLLCTLRWRLASRPSWLGDRPEALDCGVRGGGRRASSRRVRAPRYTLW